MIRKAAAGEPLLSSLLHLSSVCLVAAVVEVVATLYEILMDLWAIVIAFGSGKQSSKQIALH